MKFENRKTKGQRETANVREQDAQVQELIFVHCGVLPRFKTPDGLQP